MKIGDKIAEEIKELGGYTYELCACCVYNVCVCVYNV